MEESAPLAESVQLAAMRDLGVKLLAVTKKLGGAFDEVAAKYGLTGLQARTVLEMERPIPMSQLAASMGCDASNVTGLSRRLKRLGLVETVVGQDRRVKLLVLTADRGISLRRELTKAITEASPVMTDLDPDERAVLGRLLDKLLT